MLKEIATFIAAQTSFVIGTDLIFGFWSDDDTDKANLIQEISPGVVDGQLPDRADKIITILSRSFDYNEAYDMAKEIFDAVHGYMGKKSMGGVISGVEYLCEVIEANGTPQYIGPDMRGRHEFSTNFTFKLQNP